MSCLLVLLLQPSLLGKDADHIRGCFRIVASCSCRITAACPLRSTGEKVAIKKITNAFENLVDARRTLREMKLLRYLR